MTDLIQQGDLQAMLDLDSLHVQYPNLIVSHPLLLRDTVGCGLRCLSLCLGSTIDFESPMRLQISAMLTFTPHLEQLAIISRGTWSCYSPYNPPVLSTVFDSCNGLPKLTRLEFTGALHTTDLE